MTKHKGKLEEENNEMNGFRNDKKPTKKQLKEQVQAQIGQLILATAKEWQIEHRKVIIYRVITAIMTVAIISLSILSLTR